MQKERERFLLYRIYRFQDQKAFVEIYDTYFDRILRYLSYKLPTREDADEQAAEVFLRLWTYLQQARVENLQAMVYRTAHGIYANFYRAKASRPKEDTLSDELEVPDQSAGVEAQLSTEMSVEAIKTILPKLKDEYRDVIIMRYLDELSVGEIASALEKSENAVRLTIHRALKTIRRLLDQANLKDVC